jgi:hypothetical protein
MVEVGCLPTLLECVPPILQFWDQNLRQRGAGASADVHASNYLPLFIILCEFLEC